MGVNVRYGWRDPDDLRPRRQDSIRILGRVIGTTVEDLATYRVPESNDSEIPLRMMPVTRGQLAEAPYQATSAALEALFASPEEKKA